MSINKRLVKQISSIILSVVLVFFMISAVWAEPALKIQFYEKELKASSLLADEAAQYAIYLIDRTIMYYQMAMLTGDLSFLKEIEPLLNDVANSLDIFASAPGCRSKVLIPIDSMKYNIKNNLKVIDGILANTKVENTYDTAEIRALISEIDSINSMVLNEVNPLIISADVDILSLSFMGLAIRSNQQILMRLVLNRISPSSRTTDLIKFARNDSDYNLHVFKTLTERNILKTADDNLVKNRNSVINNTLKVLDTASKLEQTISKFQFPSKFALNIQNDFVKNMESMSTLIQSTLDTAFS